MINADIEEHLEALKYLRDDPVAFGNLVLGHEYSADQVAIARSIAKPGGRVAVHACHGSGKTYLAADIVLWFVATRRPA